MARKRRKQKAGYQKPKQRKKRPGEGGGQASGPMSGIRGAFKSAVGPDIIQVIVWTLAVAAVLVAGWSLIGR